MYMLHILIYKEWITLLVTGYVTTIWGVARYFNTILVILC